MKTKEFYTTIIFSIVLLIVYIFFPTNNFFQQIITLLLFLVVLPILFNKYIVKDIKINDFNVKNYKNGIIYGSASLIICLLILSFILYNFDFLSYRPPLIVSTDFIKFLVYEFLLVLPLVLIYNFYFSGFLIAFLNDYIGYWGILLQSIFFIILISFSTNNLSQFAPFLIFIPFAGWIAIKTKSITYSVLSQFLLIIIFHAIIIHKLG